MIGFVASAAILAAYSCQLETPRAIGFEGSKVTESEIGLPPSSLRFGLEIQSGDPLQAKVAWSGDPMQAAGQFPAVVTAPGAYAFSAFSAGPCLFTEKACLTQMNLVETSPGQAVLIMAPVALVKDEKSGSRSPFPVLARGQCTRTDLKK